MKGTPRLRTTVSKTRGPALWLSGCTGADSVAVAGFGQYAGPDPEHGVHDQLGKQGCAESLVRRVSGARVLVGSRRFTAPP